MNKDINYYMSLFYKIGLEHDDDGWVAYHPELGRGSCYVTATSKEKALKLIDKERKELFKLLMKKGIEINEPSLDEGPPSGQILLRIPKSIHRNVKDYAKSEGVSVNQFLSTLISGQIGELKASKAISKLFTRFMTSQNVKSEKYSEYTQRGLHSGWNFDKKKKGNKVIALEYKREGTNG